MLYMSSDLDLSGFQTEDDIDLVFSQLSQIEPSGELIARILTSVRHLPGPLWRQDKQEIPTDARIDALIVRNERRRPS